VPMMHILVDVFERRCFFRFVFLGMMMEVMKVYNRLGSGVAVALRCVAISGRSCVIMKVVRMTKYVSCCFMFYVLHTYFSS
jgi:hypothetical protein